MDGFWEYSSHMIQCEYTSFNSCCNNTIASCHFLKVYFTVESCKIYGHIVAASL